MVDTAEKGDRLVAGLMGAFAAAYEPGVSAEQLVRAADMANRELYRKDPAAWQTLQEAGRLLLAGLRRRLRTPRTQEEYFRLAAKVYLTRQAEAEAQFAYLLEEMERYGLALQAQIREARESWRERATGALGRFDTEQIGRMFRPERWSELFGESILEFIPAQPRGPQFDA